MPTIRRIYLYGALTIALVLLLLGLPDLVRIALDRIGGGASLGAAAVRDALSRALAFAIIGLPLWVAHAVAIGRTVAGPTDAARMERAGVTRAVTLTGTIVTLEAAAAWMAYRGVHEVVLIASGPLRPEWSSEDLPFVAAWLLVAGLVLVPYLRWRIADHRLAAERLGDDVATRIACYGTLAVAAILGLAATRDLIDLLLRLALGMRTAAVVEPIAAGVAMIAVAGTVWIANRLVGDRFAEAPDPVGPAHRRARSRSIGTHVVVLAAAVAVSAAAAASLEALVAWPLGLLPGLDAVRRLASVAGPLLAVLPFALAGLWHAVVAASEAHIARGDASQRTSIRVDLLLVACTGLATAATGAVRLLALALSPWPRIDGPVLSGAGSSPDLAPAIGALLAGLLLWAPAWTIVQGMRDAAPVPAARDRVRRAALATVIAAAGTAAGVSGAWVLDRAIRSLLGAPAPDGPVFADAIAVLTVSAAVLAYHALQLWRDVRVARAAAPPEPACGPVISEELDLVLPGDTDVTELNERIRSILPPGSAFRVRRRAHI